MTALLSLTVDLVTSTFYQKERLAGTAKTCEGDGGSPKETPFPQSYSVVKELMVLNYREAVSFIFPPFEPSERLRYEQHTKTFVEMRFS